MLSDVDVAEIFYEIIKKYILEKSSYFKGFTGFI